MNETLVIQVNEDDEVLGFLPKMEAHEKGALHRAVSILIFNSKGEWLLQRRAKEKYHSGGLWTNTCCSHPYPDEEVEQAATRRLKEEMGMRCELQKQFSFTYKAVLDSGLTEHEIDHVFTGVTDVPPELNKEEACDWKYMDTNALRKDIIDNPELYTEWFKILFPKVAEQIEIDNNVS